MSNYIKVYEAVFLGDTLGLFTSYKKAQQIIIDAAARHWGKLWKEEVLDEWIEDFLRNSDNDGDDVYIWENYVDTDMSMEVTNG